MSRSCLPALLVAAWLQTVSCATIPEDPPAPLEPLASFFGPPLAGRFRDGFGKDTLFGTWGDANVFDLDGRRLALVVRTIRSIEGNPPQARFEQQLGVYDITGDRGVSGHRFKLHAPMTEPKPFQVADRHYLLTLSRRNADTMIQIRAAGSRSSPVFSVHGQTRFPTVNELFRMRALIAHACPNTDFIDGGTYRVSAESTQKGSLLFWSEETLRRARDGEGDPRWLLPEFLAEVVDSGSQRLGDIAPFGRLINGRWWGVRWTNGIWYPTFGDEFRPLTGSDPGSSKTLRIAIPSSRQDKHHFVTMTVVGQGSLRADVRFLVDTGASAVALPESFAARLGFTPRDLNNVVISTANGKATRKTATLHSVEISGAGVRDTIHDIPVVFIPDASSETPLLGMAVLGRYRMVLDNARSEMVLERDR